MRLLMAIPYFTPAYAFGGSVTSILLNMPGANPALIHHHLLAATVQVSTAAVA